MKHGVFAALAALLALCALLAAPILTANDTVDPAVTGSIKADTAQTEAEAMGSSAFRAALALLVDGDAAGAFAAAEALDGNAERRAIQWAAIYFNSGVVDYRAVKRFAADAPDFAPASVYRSRIEQSLAKIEPQTAEVVAMLGADTPETVDGRIALAAAYLASGERQRATDLTKSLWIDEFLTEAQEGIVLAKLGTLLDGDAHWRRAEHLMMHDRARASERLLPHLTPPQQSLVKARAAVSRNEADAKALLDGVDPSMQANPVFIFSRAQRARQFELWQGAVDWLAKAPATVPDPAEWWYERRALLRKLLEVGEPQLAYQVAAGYVAGPDGRLVEARFHAGWIALSFLGDAASAKAHFSAMAELSTLPDSVTQANYWLARAELKLGNADAARAAYEAAARYGTVYYGQLARAELGQSGVQIRPLPDLQQSKALFDGKDAVRAVRLLAANGQSKLAAPLLRHLGNGLEQPGELLLAAQLAEEIGLHHVAIAIATLAEQRGAPLDSLSFPKDGPLADADLATDRAAVLAIVRQESMFQLDAVSSAGARGLMQLMPGTAQDVARKVGVDYSPSRLLSDGAYNGLLGSTYLATQLARYDGSLVLAAAAYNAGPGNADKWIRAYGDPRADNVDPVIWVELIPFQETRTYVKRVLGNYLVYRERLGNSPVTLQQALRNIR